MKLIDKIIEIVNKNYSRTWSNEFRQDQTEFAENKINEMSNFELLQVLEEALLD